MEDLAYNGGDRSGYYWFDRRGYLLRTRHGYRYRECSRKFTGHCK